MADGTPELSIIVPAHNEAEVIEPCLKAVAESSGAVRAEVIVVANGCTDNTAGLAGRWQERFAARGWSLRVIELAQGSKIAALNAGDAVACGTVRAYLDADVVVDADLMAQLSAALAGRAPGYASGTIAIPAPRNGISRAYRRIYTQVPFMTHGVPGCGLYAVNAAGRARWEAWPDIIADDTFARLQFRPDERHRVPARFHWPLVDGWRALVRVRRRQNEGVREVSARFPELLKNDDKRALPVMAKLRMALRDPLGFATYAGVSLATRLGRNQSWDRGR